MLTKPEADHILREHYAAAITDPTRYRDVVLPKLLGTLAFIALGPYGAASDHALDVLRGGTK